jgi:hypothetical protein
MTVPPLFGWEEILAVLILLVIVAVAVLVVLAAGTDASDRSEWQAWLDARSGERPDPDGPPIEPVRSGAGGAITGPQGDVPGHP